MNYEEYVVKVFSDGDKFWHQNGELHRTDGPAVENSDGAKFWYQNGKLHRTDGPACEFSNGNKLWYQNGNPHRTDGPACEHSDGAKLWYLEGIEYSEEEFNEKMKVASQPSCNGKTVEIDGKKYKLVEVGE